MDYSIKAEEINKKEYFILVLKLTVRKWPAKDPILQAWSGGERVFMFLTHLSCACLFIR